MYPLLALQRKGLKTSSASAPVSVPTSKTEIVSTPIVIPKEEVSLTKPSPKPKTPSIEKKKVTTSFEENVKGYTLKGLIDNFFNVCKSGKTGIALTGDRNYQILIEFFADIKPGMKEIEKTETQKMIEKQIKIYIQSIILYGIKPAAKNFASAISSFTELNKPKLLEILYGIYSLFYNLSVVTDETGEITYEGDEKGKRIIEALIEHMGENVGVFYDILVRRGFLTSAYKSLKEDKIVDVINGLFKFNLEHGTILVGNIPTAKTILVKPTQAGGGVGQHNIFQLLAEAQLGGEEEVATILAQDGGLRDMAHFINELMSSA